MKKDKGPQFTILYIRSNAISLFDFHKHFFLFITYIISDYSRRLSKWFVCRASKETLIRQSDEFQGCSRGKSGIRSSGTPPEPDNVLEDKFWDYIIYDSKQAATSNDSTSEDSEDADNSAGESTRSRVVRQSLKFDSHFESGNLAKVFRAYGRKMLVTSRSLEFIKDCAVPRTVDHEYELMLRNDINTNGHIQWYYFSASTLDLDSSEVVFTSIFYFYFYEYWLFFILFLGYFTADLIPI